MFYAKSNPAETIREHTEKMLEEYERLKETYGPKISDDDAFWSLLKTAILFHDAGKANLVFQNKIRSVKGEPALPCSVSMKEEIPHNYVSVALLPFRALSLSKEEWRLLVEAIGYHHERDMKPNSQHILAFVQQTLPSETIQALYAHLEVPYIAEPAALNLLKMLEQDRKSQYPVLLLNNREFFRKHVLLKGLLHRLDHAASAHVEVERGTDEPIGEKTRSFLLSMSGLRPAQRFALDHSDRNVIMTASTGIGKTESALLWVGRDKAFFALPLRVSLNAMYDRLSDENKIGIEHLGLLHSGSLDHLIEKDTIDAEETFTMSRQLSQKLTLTTIDQVLKFPFLYKGFEKELSVFSYSRIVIDEIQAYDPHIAAMLIKALEMIVQMGGKFMVMTATLPKLYLETIRDRGNISPDSYVCGTFPNDDLIRHRVELLDSDVTSVGDIILKKGKQRKVLVICNTVDQAIRVYEDLQKRNGEQGVNAKIWLLHARFIKKHKSMLENKITSFAEAGWHLKDGNASPGIWITTQIVEASLDVDFDDLYTEHCPLDSLFQRMGRCYRVRPYQGQEPNIHILTCSVSGVGSVYDAKIMEMSLDALRSYHGRVMLESEKMQLVEQMYSRENLHGTGFLDKFDNAIRLFDSQLFFDTTNKDAQKMLRDIRSKDAIPWIYHEVVDNLVQRFQEEHDRINRRNIRREIEQYAVSLNENMLHSRKAVLVPLQVQGLDYLSWIMDTDAEYCFDEQELRGKGLVYRRTATIL